MQIQINAHAAEVSDALITFMEEEVERGLSHHASKLTRVEIHLSDLNAHKGGVDKRCLIEARPRGLDPVAAEHESTQFRDAFKHALEKLDRVLAHRFGKLESR